ncbi:hypothetical protein [Bacillus marinisedimentorum]|uniref:hypothetical protein n=1 Tax=Bacillus marinisedimentorum TaxID=1821260 RepID=UPI0007DFB44A|nr:hypothetical protein [Bacillus marinisedimentorum]
MPYRKLPDQMRDELEREFMALNVMMEHKSLSRMDAAEIAFDRKLYIICTFLDQCKDDDYIRFREKIKSDFNSYTAIQNEEAVPIK